MIRLSQTVSRMLAPLVETLGEAPVALLAAIKREGKRGNGTHYPTDLKRCKVILETLHDVTGRALSVTVEGGDYAKAIARLARFVEDEDYIASHGLTLGCP